jgi:2-methylcitrate dehydratase PrpD
MPSAAHQPDGGDMIGATQQLARFISSSCWDDLPAHIRHEGRRAFLNWLGCGLGGSLHDTTNLLLAALAPCAGPPQATIIGRDERYDVLTVACVNAVAANILDFDDTHMRTIIHATVPVAAALLALGERDTMDGQRILHALILGIEVECRVGNALSPRLFDSGWHPTAVCGVIGAAAACGKALDLDVPRMARALGLAATQSSGSSEMFGTMGKSYNIGHAARNGLLAAMLARVGFTASQHAIESPRGLMGLFGDSRRIGEITAGLGQDWELSGVAYKAYPCGIVTHSVIDACLELRIAHAVHTDRIARMDITVDPITLGVCARNAEPATGLTGKLSLHHCAAVALLDGVVGVPQFADERVSAGDAVALRARISTVSDPALSKGQARVRITFDDGIVCDSAIDHGRGSLQRPLGDAEITQKFEGLARIAGLDDEAIASILADCWTLDELPDVGVLARTRIPAN